MNSLSPDSSDPTAGDPEAKENKRATGRFRSKKIWVLPILAAAGIAIGAWQPLGFDEILSYGEKVGTSPLFLAAAVVGLTVKWGIYANAVHGITDAVAAGEAVSLRTLLPLFALAALFLGGTWVKSKIR